MAKQPARTPNGYQSTAGKSWASKRIGDMTPEEQVEARAYWKDRDSLRRQKGRDKNKVARHLPAVVPVPSPAALEVVVPEFIDPTEAALAVIESQVNGHGVPAHLLHDVLAYVDHTRELAAKLREG